MIVLEKDRPQLLLDADGRPIDGINSIETEYSLVVSAEEYNTKEHQKAVDRVSSDEVNYRDHAEMAVDTPAYAIVRDAYNGSGQTFLRNARRRYVDVGGHPELSLEERTKCMETAHSSLNGHADTADFYREAARRILEKSGIDLGLFLYANNTDGKGNSWSSHSNFLTMLSLPRSAFVPALAAHNSSMHVFAGGGAVVEGKSEYGEFVYGLSERAEFIECIESMATTGSRPLVNLKNEALADVNIYRRLHMLTHDTIFAPVALALRMASTMLIVRALEFGIRFDNLRPEDPVRAIRDISHDPTLQHKVRIENGQKLTGPELQLKLAERAIAAYELTGYCTPHGKYWADYWVKLLDELRNDPLSDYCRRRIQWPVKLHGVMKAVETNRNQKAPQDEYSIAFQKALHFSRLLPDEGAGMQLVRRGFWEDSPTTEVLRDGVPLDDNRSRLRGSIIGRLEDAGIPFAGAWDEIKPDVSSLGMVLTHPNFAMADPFKSNDDAVESQLDQILRYAA